LDEQQTSMRLFQPQKTRELRCGRRERIACGPVNNAKKTKEKQHPQEVVLSDVGVGGPPNL